MNDTTPHPEPAPRDHGVTFIELLVSIVLIGMAGVAVLTALSAVATGAAVNRNVSAVQAALASAGDAVSSVDTEADHYLDCAAHTEPQIVAGYAALVDATSTGVDIADVEYWTTAGWTSDIGACAFATGERLQRVTLVASADDVTHRLAVVVRPATEPTVGVGPLSPATGGTGFGNVTITPTPGAE